jgi:hypothetical protein
MIFARYHGDIDMFGRAAGRKDKETINDDDWYLIDTLLQDAIVIDRKLGSGRRTLEAIQRIQVTVKIA